MVGVSDILSLLMRRADGISENELSRRTGVNQPTIHRILSRESPDPRTATLQPLADFFGVTVPQIRGQIPLPWEDDDPLARLLTRRQFVAVKLLDDLTEKQQDDAIRYLEGQKQVNDDIHAVVQRRKERGAT